MLKRLRARYDRASLQAKFALHVALSTALLFALLMPVVLYIQRRVVLTAVEESGFRMTDIFGRSSVQAVLADDYLVMQHVVNGIGSTRKIRYAMLLKADGEVLVHTRAIERGRRYDDAASRASAVARGPLLQELVDAEGVHVYDFTVPVYVVDEKRASARVGLSIEHELQGIARTRNSLLGFALAALALGLAWATYQAKRITQPVRALVEGTEEVARGNLDHRIAVPSGDELGHLAQAFNRMTGSVQAMVETSREISAVLDLEVVLRSIATHARRLVRGDMVFIAPLERDADVSPARVLLGGRANPDDIVIRPGVGMGGWVLANGQPLLTDDYVNDPRIVHDPKYDAMSRDEGMTSGLAMPITLQGEIIGILGVASRRPAAFGRQDVDTLQRLAQQAAIAMANARLYDEAKLKTARLETLIRVSQVMTSTLEPQRIAEVITQAMNDLAPGIIVRMWETPDDAKIWVPFGPAPSARDLDAEDDLALPAGAGLVGAVAAQRAPLVVEDVRYDDRVVRRAAIEREGIVSFLGLPLLREEKLLGVLCAATRTRRRFRDDEVSLFASLAQQAAIALENARLYQDLRHSHGELVSAQAELVRKTRMAAMGEIAAVVAHEARNPLGALTNCIGLLRGNPHITGEDAELLTIMESEAKRLNDIVSDFLAFGRPRPPQFAPVDLHELIDATWSLLQRDDRCPPSIDFERRFDPTLVSLTADRDQLRQVFWNLLLNAVQAMRQGGTLAVETRRAPGSVEVVVRDTGPGIPANILPRVFEPFVTSKAGGTGLGLAIVRRIIEDHGGRITVSAQDGEGTCFVLSLADARTA
ncbi:MAG TPA: GAF domain-containing protein [Candidatus Acidoferrum sp.]|nr:GAF domain-containing protein [Candidatus Acidoferrum sp.]